MPRSMRLFLLVTVAAALAIAGQAQSPAHAARHHHHSQAVTAPVEPPVLHDNGGPAYHAVPFKGKLPPTLSPSQWSDPRVQAAYAMAAKVEKVLYQQPCFCRCDNELGHHSLADCYIGDHASVCQTCLQEGIFTYEQTKKGKTPAQIRAAIERGDWKTINLNDYIAPRTY